MWAWNEYGPGGAPADQQAANGVINGIGVVVQDSLLTHTRALIDFFLETKNQDTDIYLSDFGRPPLSISTRTQLDHFKHSIELHVLHITAYRDPTFRRNNPITAHGNHPTDRIRFQNHNPVIAQALIDALGTSALSSGQWQKPFKDLHDTTIAMITNPDKIPAKLSAPTEIRRYLSRQRIPL
jgi:hypothetical protein